MKVSRMMFITLFVIAMFVMLSLAFVQSPEDPGDLSSTLVWLAAGPGALFFASAALSFLYERVPGWGKIVPSNLKPYIVLGVAVALSFGAEALLTQSGVVTQLSSAYAKIYMIAAGWLGSQLAFGRARSTGMLADRV